MFNNNTKPSPVILDGKTIKEVDRCVSTLERKLQEIVPYFQLLEKFIACWEILSQ